MIKMFAQMFAAFTSVFSAAEKLANSANHLAGWTEDSAATFADEARVKRAIRMNQLQKELDASHAELGLKLADKPSDILLK